MEALIFFVTFLYQDKKKLTLIQNREKFELEISKKIKN